MRFCAFAIQQFMTDYHRLPFYKRVRRTHLFVTRELPKILEIIIKEVIENDRKPDA